MSSLPRYPAEMASMASALEQMETDAGVMDFVRRMVTELRRIGTTITFDRVLIHLGEYENYKGASVYACLVVREDLRQRLAEVLAAAPIGTAH